MKLDIGKPVALLCWIDHEIVVVRATRVAARFGNDEIACFQIASRPELPLIYYFDRHEGIGWSRDLSAEAELRAAYALVRSSPDICFPDGPTGSQGPRASSVWLP